MSTYGEVGAEFTQAGDGHGPGEAGDVHKTGPAPATGLRQLQGDVQRRPLGLVGHVAHHRLAGLQPQPFQRLGPSDGLASMVTTVSCAFLPLGCGQQAITSMG